MWKKEFRTLLVDEWLSIILDEIKVVMPDNLRESCCNSLQSLVLLDNTRLIDGVWNILNELKERYYIVIISDTGIESGNYLTKRLHKDGLDFFDYYLYSDEFGRCKPYTGVFTTVLDYFDIKPEEALHIGDLRRTDVMGALSAHMHAFRFAGVNNDLDNNFPDAEYVFNDYFVLMDLIK